MIRVALKVGYIGSRYHGFQIQPDLPTVEGELLDALKSCGCIADRIGSRFAASGRTDRGVHARTQVIAFDTDNYRLTVPRIINTKLPEDIWVWARSEVDPLFDPRRDALYREYRYFLYGGSLDLNLMNEASKLFTGEHDFSGLSKRGEERSTIRKVHKIDLKKSGDLIIFDIRADAFLWQMIRRIVGALVLIGEGERDCTWIERILDGEPASITPAPAEGLVLNDVCYDGITFAVDRYAYSQMKNALDGLFRQYTVFGAVMKAMGDSEPD
ncbi:MAG: tRNA pseudouridine(38-40) synthase TruA [Candidatus Syntropharchaeales archaeon]